ncbi:MAG: cob(I)yrinic acid a,c-diamide adenosyltransferase [Bacteriovoracaceae bacterium]|nr:cob(I)yrinic acid a,c-diamide adenosyltransferase [Bacteriovoracaceae bacterium]
MNDKVEKKHKSGIYTKTGDGGTTSLVGGTKVLKDHDQIDSYGNVDELNSVIGLLRNKMGLAHGEQNLLFKMQNELFVLGSILATEVEKREMFKLPTLSKDFISEIESHIDVMDSKLEKLKNFILPGGDEASCVAHLARTVCRRTERSMVKLSQLDGDSVGMTSENDHLVPPLAIQLINRLSDYFFVLARFLNHESGIDDVIWRSSTSV